MVFNSYIKIVQMDAMNISHRLPNAVYQAQR